MNTFEKGYQAWKASKAALAAQATKNSFELSNFDQKYLQWQYNTGRITEEQALAQLNKPYTDFIGRVNNVLSGYDQFAKNYTARFGSRKNDLTDAWVGNSQQYLADTQAYRANLISQTDAILKTLEANPDAFDKDTVDQIKSALHTARTNVENITKVAEQDNAYWSSWGTDEESRVDKFFNALNPDSALNPFRKEQQLTGEAAYTRAQQDQTYANKYNGVSGVQLLDVINSLDDGAEKEWVTGQALRTMAFDEAQAVVETMEQEFLELSQTGTLRNHYKAGMALTPEEEAAAKAAIAQYESVMKKYGIDTKDEDAEPMEELSDLIQQRKTLVAESKRVQEHIKLSNVRENKDFNAYAKKGEAEAMEYAEKNKKTAHMTNKEIDVLAYYIAKDRENGTNLAEQYKDSLKFYLKHRRAEEIADWVNDLPGVVKALTLPRITYAATAKTMNWGQDVLQNFSNRKLNQTVFQMADDYIGQDLSGAARIAHQTAGVVGYMAPSILASKFIGGATGVSSLGKAAGSVALYLGSAGSAYGDAIEKGYDKPVARAYSTLVGLSEVALQNVLGGISEFGGLPAKLDGKIAAIKNVLLKSAAKYGVSIAGEEIEENLQNFLEPAIRAMVLGEEYDMPTKQEIFDTIITTALSTGGMEGPGIVKDTIKDAKVDKLIGENINEHSFLTPRERVVVNTITAKLVAEAEQGGKKLSQKEKQAIYDQVVEDMDTGRIDIKDIENSIGKGTEYEQLVSEFEELKELNKMKPEEMTGDQLDRRNELRKKNLEIGDKYGYGYRGYEKYIESYDKAFPKAVEGLVNSDRLSESYRERDRRSEKYKVEDLNRYSEAQRQTIQAAMDSGILNNTRRTHEFVELIAKLSEKMGVKFNFTDNQRLKESGFAIDGVTVNGYVNQDGITINVNSAKALNRVVGHEITHILEGTDLYDRLAMAVAAYAKTKGEYESRLQQIRELYKGKEGYTGEEGANTRFQAELNAEAKFEKELIADLVGDYIFTDKQFVEKLFNEDRGLFNWIRKQIDYIHSLCKAGSKEARQLEKAKKMFTEVVNEAKKKGVKNPTAEGQTENGIYEKDDAVVADMKEETIYSLTNNQKFMDKAIEQNRKTGSVSESVMLEAKASREKVATRLTKIRDEGKVAIPEDVEGNTFFGNSAYGGSEENTTICPRSLAAEAFVDAVSELVGRPLTWEEQIYISQDLQQPGRTLTPECIYCYVATDRKAYRVFLGEYIKQRDAVIDAYKNGNTDTARSGSLYQEFLNGRKDTDNMWKRFSMWINAYKNGTPMVKASHLTSMEKLMGDIQSEFGKELKAQIKDAMAYAQSASWAKKRVGYVAYNGHILKWKQDRINKLNSHYGLRMYSFSDFSPAFILENMQMITDAAVRGLKMLGYTKELDFVKIFAPSGMNINISTFGFEMNGNVYENNIIGANWTEAQKLRAKHPNVGITFVATNDTLVEWALEQDWIDVVIPLHLVRTGKELVQKLGFKDYTGESADTKTKDWKTGDQKSIAPTEHNNDKTTYLEALQKNHLRPRFERYIDNPNYMKLVNECRQSASESKPVQPIFDETAANESLAKLEANGYYQPIGGSVDRMYEIAADVADNIVKKNGIYSLSAQKQVETAGGGWDVRGQDVSLPMPEKTTVEADQEETEVSMSEDNVLDELLQEEIYQLDQQEKKKEALQRRLEATQNLQNHLGEELQRAKEKYAKHKNKNSGSARNLLKKLIRLSYLSQNPTVLSDQIRNIQNQIEALDKKNGEAAPTAEDFQESTVAGTKTEQAKPVNLPGLEKSQTQSQGKAQEVGLPGLEGDQESRSMAGTTQNSGVASVATQKSEARRAAEYHLEETKKNAEELGIDFEYQKMQRQLEQGRPLAETKNLLGQKAYIQKKSNGKYIAYVADDANGGGFVGNVLEVECDSFDEAYLTIQEYFLERNDAYRESLLKEHEGVDLPGLEGGRQSQQASQTQRQTEDGVSPGDAVRAEQQSLDAEFKRQMGDDSSYYDPAEGEEIETARERLEVQRSNLQIELRKNQRLRQEMIEDFDQKIEAKQAQYDGKKLKHSKTAQALLRDIEKLKRKKADRLAEFDKAIAQIERRIEIKDEKLATNKPEKQDRLEKAYERIDRERDAAELDLIKEYNEKKATISKGLDNKEQWIKNKAFDVLWEMGEWVKGETPSRTLGRIWDIRVDGRRLEWDDIKHALADIKDGYAVLPNQAENAIREVLERTYQDRVTELSALEESFNRDVEKLNKDAEEKKEKAQIVNIKKEVRARYLYEAAKLAGDISGWKDKNTGFAAKKNTLRRNLFDVVRNKDGTPNWERAAAIDEWLNGNYNHNEALLKKEAAELFEKYRKLNINKEESAYIQMLGEFLQGTNDKIKTNVSAAMLEAFRKEYGDKINEEKCRKVVDMARQDYDALFERVNEVLRANGMTELPYVKGYFPHMQEIQQNWIQKILNIKPVEHQEKPTEVAGISGAFKPNKKSQGYSKERKGPETEFNFLKGYQQYVAGVLDWIHHIPDIQRRRALENFIRITHAQDNETIMRRVKEIQESDEFDANEEQEELNKLFEGKTNPLGNFVTDLMIGTNTLAGKKTSGDRLVEDFLNPDVNQVINQISSRVSANLVAGSFSAGLSNLAAIPLSWGGVSPISTLAEIGHAFKNTFDRWDDGLVAKSDFLTNRLRNPEKLYKETWDHIGEAVSWWGSWTDNFVTQVIWRSRYRENMKSGMTETQAIKDADIFAESVLAGRSRGNMPTLFESRNFIAKAFTTCQLEVNNQYGYLLKDMPRDQQVRAKNKLVAGFMKVFIGSHMINQLFFMPVTGRRVAFDPITIISQLLMGLIDDEEENNKAILRFAEDVLQEIPLIGGWLGGGRVPISSAMPYDGLKEMVTGTIQDVSNKNWWGLADELSNPLYYLVPPMGGGQIRKTVQGLNMYGAFDWLTGQDHSESGNYTNDGRLRYTVSDNPLSILQKALFGKWAGQNAQQYIEEGRSPLSQKQTQEFFDLGVSIEEYWDIQDGLKELNRESESGRASINEVGDYIGGLDLTTQQKNILINNYAGRKNPIDMTDYDNYDSFEEFDYATQNPGKYAVSQAVGGFEKFKAYQEAFDNFGSKEKLVKYINNMKIPYGAKIILFVNEYKTKANREKYGADIVEYLNGRKDISRDEMIQILEELGFTVKNGKVSY